MPTPEQEQSETIRQVVRGMGLQVPLVRETLQTPIANPVPIPRVSAGTWLVHYAAASAVTPDADDPAWAAHVTGDATGTII